MKTLTAVALVSMLVLAACESGGSSRSPADTPSTGSGGDSRLRPSDIRPATDPVTVSWFALKDAVGRRGDPKKSTKEMHLINKAHPGSKKPIPLNAFKKVLSNDQMGALLALLDERQFTRLSTPGLSPRSIPAGTANGAIVVRRGDRVRTMVFKKGMTYGTSPVPKAYRECRDVIIGVWNKADQYQVYVPEERVLGIERLK
jgi:hypothetical protein